LYTFLDYIAGGCEIGLMVAVDFTVSVVLFRDTEVSVEGKEGTLEFYFFPLSITGWALDWFTNCDLGKSRAEQNLGINSNAFLLMSSSPSAYVCQDYFITSEN